MRLCVPRLPGALAYLFPVPPWDQATPRSPSPPGPPRPPGSRGGDLGGALAGPARAAALTRAGLWQVIYKEKDSDTQPRVWLVEGNSSRSAQLTGLGKYVLYEVQVLAFTRVGDGSPSHPPVLERTLDDGEFEPLPAGLGETGTQGDREAPASCPSGVTFCPIENRGLGRLLWTASHEGHQPHGQGGADEGLRVPQKETTAQGLVDI